ncbi:acyltransferase [Streptosporangium sp. KLBMP 9127]|nr:acyltransferase [Streptosporangium sp. KLBMP 9127]
MVFLGHAVFPVTMGNQNPATPFSDEGVTMGLIWFFNPIGALGLSFFFMLSGFVITWSTRPGDKLGDYYRRRVVKIMPNHVVTWALAMLLFAGAYTRLWGLPNLFLVNPFVNDNALWGGANMPAWSLGVEMLFYVLFPLLILPIRKISESRLWLWAGVAVAGIFAVCVITVTLVSTADLFPGQQLSLTQFWFSYMFPPARLVEFVVGMILARIVIAGRWPRIGVTPVLILVLISFAATLWVPQPYNIALVTAVPFFLVIGTFASANLRGRKTVMGGRTMEWLGKVSFAFFLTQSLVIYWLRPTVLGDAEYGLVGGIVLLVGLVLVNVLAGWALYTFVEMPTMRRWSPRRNKPPVEEPPARPAPIPAGTATE